MKSRYSVSVVTPIYNEAALLEKSLLKINSFLKKNFQQWEIIVVESGSTDGSDKLCDDLTKKFPRMRVIHEGEKRGYGSALKLGFKKAKHDLIWPVTVDLPFPLSTILRAMPLLSKYDCILSFRSQDKRKFPRRFQSFIFNSICKFALNLPVTHVNSAFKVFKRNVIGNMKLISKGWLLDCEICYRLRQNKVSLVEIGVPLVERPYRSSSVKFFTSFSIAIELLGFFFKKDQ